MVDRSKIVYDRYTYEWNPAHGFYLYGWSTYPAGSVLEGQPMKCFLSSHKTINEVMAVQPTAQASNRLLDPVVNLNHLPDENDPVPGGMYPDDWE